MMEENNEEKEVAGFIFLYIFVNYIIHKTLNYENLDPKVNGRE